MKSHNLLYSIYPQARNDALPVHLLASCLRSLSYLLAVMAHLFQVRRGLVTSGAVFIFWLLSATCGGITFRSVVRSGKVIGELLIEQGKMFII